jgi:hypothetical protein
MQHALPCMAVWNSRAQPHCSTAVGRGLVVRWQALYRVATCALKGKQSCCQVECDMAYHSAGLAVTDILVRTQTAGIAIMMCQTPC